MTAQTQLLRMTVAFHPADSHFDYSRPARTLLEASARRMAQHARSDSSDRDPADSAAQQTALIISFMAAYAAAAAAGTANWATFSDVKDMFAGDAVLVTQDRQVFKGKQQVLRRLDQGGQAMSAATFRFKNTGPHDAAVALSPQTVLTQAQVCRCSTRSHRLLSLRARSRLQSLAS